MLGYEKIILLQYLFFLLNLKDIYVVNFNFHCLRKE